MSTPAFYTESVPEPGGQIELDGKEAWHALGVKRLQPGDAVRIMDGRGAVAEAVVDSVNGRQSAMLRVVRIEHFPRLQPDIVLASAIAKGDRQSTMLDMASQLGITAWQPLDCERSVSKPGKNSYQRWQKICLEACKQSGSAWLPEILPVLSPETAARGAMKEGREVLFAHPTGVSADEITGKKLMLMIGPEGGFTEGEAGMLEQLGTIRQGLGKNILRIETAAISMLAKYRIG